MGGLRWTHKTTRKLAAELRRRGIPISHTSVVGLLKAQDYSLRTNRKLLAGTDDPERDRQFHLLARRRNRFQNQGWPVISIDAKKRELVGNFKNPGQAWCRQDRAVLDHDFPSWAAGHAIPFGVYDIARNAGYVVVGVSHETSAFVVRALRSQSAVRTSLCGGWQSGVASTHGQHVWRSSVIAQSRRLDGAVAATTRDAGPGVWGCNNWRMSLA